jgi:glucose/arabinose dehydrogenase
VAEGLASPVYLTSPASDPRLFIVEQPGRVRIVASGQLLPTPFLDLTGRVRSGGERGLLSLAFHPDYASNRFLYVNYTDVNGNTRVERYRTGADPDRADPASARLLLQVTQPFSNHNGGQLQFGPDGMLYVFMGDGGGAGDPLASGQDLSTLLGAVLRLDVDGGDPYAIPADNPFIGQPGARPEIWAFGLRNPWRASFDRSTGTLYIADVGQGRVEEINAAPGTAAGLNYGWNVTEGSSCFLTDPCDTSGLTLPVAEYDHGQGCSVTGGYVYRGSGIPEVAGHYFYSDFCAGFLRSFRLEGGIAVDPRTWASQGLGAVTSFGEDSAGELYVLSQDGRVVRLVATRP